MAYKVIMKDGSTVEIAATRQMKDGSGLYLYDENDVQVASFVDGTFNACYQASAPVTPAPPEAE